MISQNFYVQVFGELVTTILASTDCLNKTAKWIIQALMYLISYILGAQGNPCVYMAYYLLGHISWRVFMILVVTQYAGALVGTYATSLLVPKKNNPDVPKETKTFSARVFLKVIAATVFAFGCSAYRAAENESIMESTTKQMGTISIACSYVMAYVFGAILNPLECLFPLDRFFKRYYNHIIATCLGVSIWQYVNSEMIRSYHLSL